MKRALILALALACAACTSQMAPAAAPPTEAAAPAAGPDYGAAVADAARPPADVERDALRHPAAILAFAGVAPGQHVVDLGAGGGYYTRLFSAVVGPQGRVTAVIRPPRPDATERPRIYAVSEDPRYANVVVNADGYVLALDQPADVIFVSQIYHDFFLPQLAIDPAAAARAMFAALKPGGTLIIIDHSAAPGSPVVETASTLHRIDEAAVVRDMQAAGFVLEADAQTLRNPADDRSIRVFEGDIRGRTDQFVLRFRKPN
ncbi:MAG: class I SAM-dependent methyltransferase [Hydrogenophilaceae bacterium]|jgi:predicted methyltransferase|nr:class I SAM-dependent methyltransferase [Hydrogenophilaceae bacterium]